MDQLVTGMEACKENRTEAVDRVQIKPKSQRAPASCIPSNQEPGIGAPTPAVTSQGVGWRPTRGPHPGLSFLGSPEGGEQRLSPELGLPDLKEQAPQAPSAGSPSSLHPDDTVLRPPSGLSLGVIPQHELHLDFFTSQRPSESVVVKSWTIGIINRAVQLLCHLLLRGVSLWPPGSRNLKS